MKLFLVHSENSRGYILNNRKGCKLQATVDFINNKTL